MDLYELAERQHAVFTREQARAIGWTDRRLAGFLARGAADRAAPGVFTLAGVPPSWPQRLHVAVLSCPGSLASHRAAARLRGTDGFEQAPLEVVVERGRHRRTAERGVVLHESKDLRGVDFDECEGIPCTSLVRTLVDLPAACHEFKAGVALDQAIRRDPRVLERVMQRHIEVARRGRNGTVALRALLAERSDANLVDSGFERRALRLIAASDLPSPVTQHHVVEGDFQCWLDIAWPQHLVAMECDSLANHQGERAFRWERIRRRHLKALGWTVLEFTYREVTQQGPMVLSELARYLPIR
ncbi:MAG TPA: type IV toxin-antitoxin system AbiEi family antitoxin domain-containing protein [Iamia sp.]|nr:type IV toxin-antitoxin system AbiEi family antitoxin domain-containing protein [Iamia sp.]